MSQRLPAGTGWLGTTEVSPQRSAFRGLAALVRKRATPCRQSAGVVVGHAALRALGLLLVVMVCPWCAGGRASVAGGEIRLRDAVTTTAAVVRLSDIADLSGLDAPIAASLSRVIIAPGPTRSHPRVLAASQVRQTLEHRGVDMTAQQLAGANRVTVHFGQALPASPGPAATLVSAPTARRSARRSAGNLFEQQLAELVAQQLQQLAGNTRPWKVEVHLTTLPPADVLQASHDVRVDPPRAATEGTHQLVAWLSQGAVSTRIGFEARVWQVVPVVVAVRAVERGERLQAQDVALRYVEQVTDTDRALRRLEDAVGREVRQPLSADQPVTARHLQQPLLVRKRDPVEVWVRCGGIQAHRRAVALSDGALGDTIPVDTDDGSKTQFLARVTDIRTVEVLPNATHTAVQPD